MPYIQRLFDFSSGTSLPFPSDSTSLEKGSGSTTIPELSAPSVGEQAPAILKNFWPGAAAARCKIFGDRENDLMGDLSAARADVYRARESGTKEEIVIQERNLHTIHEKLVLINPKRHAEFALQDAIRRCALDLAENSSKKYLPDQLNDLAGSYAELSGGGKKKLTECSEEDIKNQVMHLTMLNPKRYKESALQKSIAEVARERQEAFDSGDMEHVAVLTERFNNLADELDELCHGTAIQTIEETSEPATNSEPHDAATSEISVLQAAGNDTPLEKKTPSKSEIPDETVSKVSNPAHIMAPPNEGRMKSLILGLHVKGNSSEDIGMRGRPAVKELTAGVNALYSKHNKRSNEEVHKEIFLYSVGKEEKNYAPLDAEVSGDEIKSLPVSEAQRKKIQEAGPNFDRTYLILHMDSGRPSNAFDGKTLGNFYNSLGIRSKTLYTPACDIAREPAATIHEFGNTILDEPVIKASPYPVFINRSGQKTFKPFRQGDLEPAIDKDQVKKAGKEHAKFFKRMEGVLKADKSLYYQYSKKASATSPAMEEPAKSADVPALLAQLEGVEKVKVTKAPNETFSGTLKYKQNLTVYIRYEKESGEPQTVRNGDDNIPVFIKMDGNKHPEFAEIGLMERVIVRTERQEMRRTYQVERAE